jgi:MarR family transcriptional regulator, organic hydroperoxide resistance regulator
VSYSVAQDITYSVRVARHSESEPAIDDQLCFALYAASRAMISVYRRLLDSLGLTYTQYIVLLALWENGAMPMGRLGERLGLDSGTLTPVLKRMVAQQLVTRRRSPRDERTVEVACTPTGLRLRERVRAVEEQVRADAGLSGDEIAGLRSQLRRLTKRLREDRVP